MPSWTIPARRHSSAAEREHGALVYWCARYPVKVEALWVQFPYAPPSDLQVECLCGLNGPPITGPGRAT